MSTTQVIKSLSRLSEDELRTRLGDLDGERKAVMVLLRAVRARRSFSGRGLSTDDGKEVDHAE